VHGDKYRLLVDRDILDIRWQKNTRENVERDSGVCESQFAESCGNSCGNACEGISTCYLHRLVIFSDNRWPKMFKK